MSVPVEEGPMKGAWTVTRLPSVTSNDMSPAQRAKAPRTVAAARRCEVAARYAVVWTKQPARPASGLPGDVVAI